MSSSGKWMISLSLLVFACTKSKFSGSTGQGVNPSAGATTETALQQGQNNKSEIKNGVDQANSHGSSESPSGLPGSPDKAGGENPNSDLAACVEGDKAVIPWTGEVKDCFDQGKTYHFDRKICAEIRKASFACNWANVQEKLQEKGILTDVLKNDAAKGAKLISCGQSADSNRIVVQWVKVEALSSVKCNSLQESPYITTGCYTYYLGTPPPPAANEEERRKSVFACLDTL